MAVDAPAPLRILVVDDDELDRQAVRRCLVQSGIAAQADEAAQAAEALEQLTAGNYDCILLDYYLPGISGLELLQQIRRAKPDLPVLIFTGRGDEDVAVELMKAGAADYLPKTSLTPERLASGLRHSLEVTRVAVAQRRAEEELRAQEARFRTLANAIPQLAWMADTSGQRTWFNQRWLDYTGNSAAEMQGWGWRSVHHPDHAQRVLESMQHAFQSGQPWEDTYPLRNKDGTYRWFLSRAIPITAADGKISGWLGTNTDVTESKRAETLLRLLSEAAQQLLVAESFEEMVRGLFERIQGPLGVDAYFGYLVNDTGDGLQLASFVGVPDEVATAAGKLDFGVGINGTAAMQRQPIHATNIQQSDDPHVHVAQTLGIRAYSCYPLLAEYRLLGTLSFASRTKDAFTPDELDFLRTASHYVSAAFERLQHIGQLREGDRRKDEFLATLAHELRNPLAPLTNLLELMKRANDEGPLLVRARDTMERQLGQLVQLVDDLLDVSRITRGKLELRLARIELASIIHQALEAVRPLADAAQHELKVSLPTDSIYLQADPVRLAQILGNLLTNACKYTEPGGRIWLTVERQGSDAVVSVKDTGIGIPADKLHVVFEMFAQVQSALERSQGGLGIGLMLVKRLVEMHGGSIEAASDGPGRGSQFTMRLPVLLDEPRQVAPPLPMHVPTEVTGRKILVVDDNRDSASSLAMLLRIMGNSTHEAHDGLEALDAAERFRPEVMLLDIGLPKLNGYDVCRKIRELPWSSNLVMVALTGWGQDEDRRKSHEAGFHHHMVKPVDYAALLKLLAKSGLPGELAGSGS